MASTVLEQSKAPVIKKKNLSQEFRDEFIKTLQGKEFILYGGLLTLAHAEGFKGFRLVQLVPPSDDNGQTAIVAVVAIDKDGNEWHGLGDANDKNCNSKVAAHKIRMADTRAKGRALRDMLGIDIVLDSELTDPYEKEMITQEQTRTIKRIMKDKGFDRDYVAKLAFEMFGVKTASRLLKEQADSLIAELELRDENDPAPMSIGFDKTPFDDKDEEDDDE